MPCAAGLTDRHCDLAVVWLKQAEDELVRADAPVDQDLPEEQIEAFNRKAEAARDFVALILGATIGVVGRPPQQASKFRGYLFERLHEMLEDVGQSVRFSGDEQARLYSTAINAIRNGALDPLLALLKEIWPIADEKQRWPRRSR